MRREVSALALVVAIAGVAGGCSSDEVTPSLVEPLPQTTVVTRPAISAEAASLAATALEDVLQGHSDAWNAMDPEAITAFWDDEMVFEDTGNADLLSGDRLFAMPEAMATFNPESRGRITDIFVARGVALYLLDGWGVDFESVSYTEDDPFQEVGRIQLGTEGTFERWTIYYGIEFYERANALRSLVTAARSLLDSYSAAWQTGDAAEIAALYSDEAVFVDSFFDTEPVGNVEIREHAASFFGWYPQANFARRLVFTDNRATINDSDRVGLVLRIGNVGTGGSDCTVEMAVILTAEDGLIVHEERFWDAESLISCGWAI